MEIHQLRYFVAIAETGSFTVAAARSHVAQPSLSQQVRKLEEELGHRLFDRMPRGAALTDAGQALLPRARRILSEINTLGSGLASDVLEGRGPLVIGAIPTMAPYLLPPLLARFTRQFPECELTIVEDLTDRLVGQLVDHRIDLAILSTPIDHDAIELSVVGEERLLMVVPSGHTLIAERVTVSLADVDGEPAVVLHDLHCLGEQIESFCSSRRLTRRIVCRSTQLSTVLELVGLGLGISFIPEMCARGDRSKRRAYVSLADGDPTREIAVARRRGRTPSGLSRAFEEILSADLDSGRHRMLHA